MTAFTEKDIRAALEAGAPGCEELAGRTVFVTGATGLIGRSLIWALLDLSARLSPHIRIVALVRDEKKALRVFDGRCGDIELAVGDVARLPDIGGSVDYIVHAAGMTASRAFVERPVETISTAVDGTRSVLELARAKRVRSMVYLSSMEVYGAPLSGAKIAETSGAELDTMTARSSYPESKRLCETLCRAYADEYGVEARVIRLTQTLGPGAEYDDARVVAEFARCAAEGRDIVLRTAGETKRSYLYTADAASAILTVLLRGEKGEAYNAANESTYCSIREMAELVASKCAAGRIKVVYGGADSAMERGYAPVLELDLDTSRLRALGWQPTVGLEEAFSALIGWYRALPRD